VATRRPSVRALRYDGRRAAARGDTWSRRPKRIRDRLVTVHNAVEPLASPTTGASPTTYQPGGFRLPRGPLASSDCRSRRRVAAGSVVARALPGWLLVLSRCSMRGRTTLVLLVQGRPWAGGPVRDHRAAVHIRRHRTDANALRRCGAAPSPSALTLVTGRGLRRAADQKRGPAERRRPSRCEMRCADLTAWNGVNSPGTSGTPARAR
jgi:hypothetical protein